MTLTHGYRASARRVAQVLLAMVLIALFAVTVPSGVAHAASARPNIVVLMVDDLAEMDLRIWNRMPTIKQVFVDHGRRLVRYSGNDPLCCPGRVNFLTGQWASHHGVTYNDARLFDPSESIATELHHAGYWTMISGKYLNGVPLLADKTPPGWDHAAIMTGCYWGCPLFVDGTKRPLTQVTADYSTDVTADLALTWLKKAPVSKPLFVMLTPYAAHEGKGQGVDPGWNMPSPAPRHLGDPRCAGIKPWSPPGYNEADVSDKPAYVQALVPVPFAAGWPMTKDCESLLSVDEELARVKAEFIRRGDWDNTLLVLVGDNGMAFGAHRWDKKQAPYATPMPGFEHWTNGIGIQPGTVTASIQNVDWAPTFCALAGCAMGPFHNGFGVDGIDVSNALFNGGRTGRDALYEEYPDPTGTAPWNLPDWRGLRTTPENPLGLWVYTEYVDGSVELYDLTNDPWELQNHHGDPAYADVEAALAARLVTP